MSSAKNIGLTAQLSASFGKNNQINRVAAASFGLRWFLLYKTIFDLSVRACDAYCNLPQIYNALKSPVINGYIIYLTKHLAL